MSFWLTILIILAVFVTPIVISHAILGNKFKMSIQTKEDKAIMFVFAIILGWYISIVWIIFKLFNKLFKRGSDV